MPERDVVAGDLSRVHRAEQSGAPPTNIEAPHLAPLLALHRAAGNAAVNGLLAKPWRPGLVAAGEAVGELGPDQVAGGEAQRALGPDLVGGREASAWVDEGRPEHPGQDSLNRALIDHETAHLVGRSQPHRLVNQGPGREQAAPEQSRGGLRARLQRAASGLSVQRCGGKPSQSGPPAILTKSTVAGPTTTDCGGFSWGARWSLSGATSSTNGFVVQEVNWIFDIKDAAGTPVDGPTRMGFPAAFTHFWEGWQVRGGQVFVGTTTSPHNADTYGSPGGGDGTKGSITIRGRANFYPDVTLPSGFAARNAPPAWALPVTTSDPGLPAGTGALDHNITATWDCTPTSADRTTHVTTT